jgi:hypothetical protein
MAMGRFPLTGPRASSQRRKKKKNAALLGRFKRAGPGCGFASAHGSRMGWAKTQRPNGLLSLNSTEIFYFFC